ncbi:hypothetical protein PHJA_000825300 [Phtheirospermum japonicum]|uniref:Uncharacterized protein n=1 Tax=Phtheirospermum japonicum TaxID=374723 RepID=A0A830BT19_9LAMI|nr:hypothetical protein PHJA_000825300 [Phtheirospermum japonicum]
MEGESSRRADSHAAAVSDSPRPPPASAGRIRARPDGFLIACRCFSFITSLAAMLCIAVNVLSAVRSFRNGSDIFDGIFRCYAVVIAVFVVVAETEWGVVMKFWKQKAYCAPFANDIVQDANGLAGSRVLGRQGNAADLICIFSSVAVMTRAYPEYLRDRQELFLLQSIASYLLLACGVVYVISGVLCIGAVKRARQKKELSREQAIKDLEDLERRREELESLLIPDHV